MASVVRSSAPVVNVHEWSSMGSTTPAAGGTGRAISAAGANTVTVAWWFHAAADAPRET